MREIIDLNKNCGCSVWVGGGVGGGVRGVGDEHA